MRSNAVWHLSYVLPSLPTTGSMMTSQVTGSKNSSSSPAASELMVVEVGAVAACNLIPAKACMDNGVVLMHVASHERDSNLTSQYVCQMLVQHF